MQLNKIIASVMLLIVANLAYADIQVSNVQDIHFTDFDLHSYNDDDISLCVYNSDSNSYRITVYSNNGNGDFVMSNGVSSFTYQVNWSQTANGNGYIELHPNTPQTMMGASRQANCDGRNNANLQIHVSAAALQNITAGDYFGTLNIRVEPV